MFAQQSYSSQPYASSSEPLAFFNQAGSSSSSPYYAGSRSSLEGNMGAGGAYASGTMASSARLGSMVASGEGRWWEAFGTGGFEGEAGLMEGECAERSEVVIVEAPLTLPELGINPSHILQKSLTVLNPLSRVDEHIMDDADLAGPFVFCFAFAFVLLLVSRRVPQCGCTTSFHPTCQYSLRVYVLACSSHSYSG